LWQGREALKLSEAQRQFQVAVEYRRVAWERGGLDEEGRADLDAAVAEAEKRCWVEWMALNERH